MGRDGHTVLCKASCACASFPQAQEATRKRPRARACLRAPPLRLMLLEQKFNLHIMLNTDKESLSQKAAPHRDFYNVRKVRRGPCGPVRRPWLLRPCGLTGAIGWPL